MESIDVEEIKYVIIDRHEAGWLDGTNNFSQQVNMLSYLGYWHKVYSQRVCNYSFGLYSPIHWRSMYFLGTNQLVSKSKFIINAILSNNTLKIKCIFISYKQYLLYSSYTF